MVLILEAPDNCGKSTQVEKIIHLFHDKSIHQLHYSFIKGFSEKEDIQSYSCKLYSDMFQLLYSNYKDMDFILDRSHIGEMVYGPLYRKYNGDYVILIENYWKDYKDFWNEIYLITFIDNPSNIIEREDGKSLSIKYDMKIKEIDNFIKAHNKSLIKNKLIINIENKSIDEVFNQIREFINK